MVFRQRIMNLEDTRRVGRALACCISLENPAAILFYGQMGAGKTTIIRAIVEALPGGDEAEVSSPSFTISNIYATTPEVRHFDLYRLEEGCSDESLLESFDDRGTLTLVEWPERLPSACLPPDGLEIRLGQSVSGADHGAKETGMEIGQCRDIVITPIGEKGRRTLSAFQAALPPAWQKNS